MDLKAAITQALRAGPREGAVVSDTEDFHEGRRGRIGGSDHNDMLDLPPYGCSRRLYYDKSGVEPDYPDADTPAMRSGRRLEPVAREKFLEDYPTERLLGHNLRFDAPEGLDSWLVANVDALMRGVGPIRHEPEAVRSGAQDYVWECKVRDRWGIDRIQKGGVPAGIRLQVLAYQLLSGRIHSVMYFFRPHPEGAIIYEHSISAKDIERLERVIRIGRAFWERVEQGTEPDRKDAGYRGCQNCQWRETCWQGPPPQTEEQMSDELVKIVDKTLEMHVEGYLEVREEAKAVTEEKKALAKLLKEALEQHGTNRASIAGHRVCRIVPDTRSKTGIIKDLKATPEGREWLLTHINGIDLSAAEEDFPELVQRHTRQGSPRLTIY